MCFSTRKEKQCPGFGRKQKVPMVVLHGNISEESSPYPASASPDTAGNG